MMSKGLGIVLEELKQWLQVKSIKIMRNDERIEQLKRNGLFHQDQKRVYQQWNRKVNSDAKPDAYEDKKIRSNIWDSKEYHRKDAEWLREERGRKDDRKQRNIAIAEEMVTQHTTQIPNWKCLGPDGVQGYWLKNLTQMHKRISAQLNEDKGLSLIGKTVLSDCGRGHTN